MNLTDREPVAVGGGIVALANAVVTLLLALGVVDHDVGAALVGLVTVATPIIMAMVRKRTWNAASVNQEIADALTQWRTELIQLGEAQQAAEVPEED